MRIIRYSCLLFVMLLVVSCSDSFLEPDPKSFYVPENVYVDRAGFDALLVTMRKNLVRDTPSGGRGYSLMLNQWTHTDAGMPQWTLDTRTISPSFSPDFYIYLTTFRVFYQNIKDANVAISRIDDIEWDSDQERNQVLAEALWHRSYWYNRLVHSYGNVPWVGEEVEGAVLDFNTHSRWAILDQIQMDMEWAVEWMPEFAAPGTPTKGAANHLLSKIYMANMEWDSAIDAATKVINGPYGLMRDRFGIDSDVPYRNVIWDLHRPPNKNRSENMETILAIVDRYEAPADARTPGGLYTMRTFHPDWWHARHRDSEGAQGMTRQAELDNRVDTLGSGNPDVALTEWYIYHVWQEGEYTWENTPDLRRSDINWVEIDDITYNNPESVNYGEPWNIEWMSGERARAATSMYSMPVYKTMVPEQDPNASFAQKRGGHGDWYLYRLAETYLMRAEAHYWKGNLAAAADDINEVRSRAKAPPISASDVTIDYIFDERARELFAETQRQNEMVRVSITMAELGMNGYSPESLHESNWFHDRSVRLNYFYPDHPESGVSRAGVPYPIGSQLTVFGQNPYHAPHYYLFPIPDEVITSNTLGRINQNLGYEGASDNEPPLETIDYQTPY